MTEDYKKRLIEYLTNLLNIENSKPTDFDPYNEVIITDDYTSDEWKIVYDSLGSKACKINGILEDESSENYIMYGGYQENSGENSKGFLIYMNKENHPFKVILLPSVRGFQLLKFDAESNRVYGICCDRANYKSTADNDAYFCYLNNLFLTYEDYYPPRLLYETKIFTGSGGSASNQYGARDIIKHPDYSYYLIFGTTESGFTYPRVDELRINVGEADELKTWVISTGDDAGMSFIGWYNDDTPHFKGIITKNYGTTPQFYLYQDNGDNVSTTALSCDTTLDIMPFSTIIPEYVSIGQNNIYYVYNVRYTNNGTITQQTCIYRYDGTTTIKTIYKSLKIETQNNVVKNTPSINLVQDVEKVYAIKYENNNDDGDCKIKLLNLITHSNPEESDWKEIGVGSDITALDSFNTKARLVREYNLVSFISYAGYIRQSGYSYSNKEGFCNRFTTIISALGYTGYKYTDKNVLVPNYVNLYNNNNILFSRNVYDTTTFENTMTSSVEVPSNYLNNITIDEEKLLGKTNYTLVDATKEIQKNIYEVLHINYFNTINVIDEDTNKIYKLGAIKLNQSTTNGGDSNYTNTPCLKYRVNYVDGTNLKNTLNWTNINDLVKQTYFTIYVEKAIKNIDIISNDESTIYLTINGDFEIDNYYRINQKVRIGNKPTPTKLVYNSQDVLYNGEQIKVYTY